MAGFSQPSHHLIVPALSMSPSLSPLSDCDYEKKATTFISSCFSDGPEKKKITHSSSMPAPEMLKKRKKADFEEDERKLMVEKKGRAERKKKKKVVKEIPTGYVHVRARRGEATDSHSLAERARREKISDRMKLLQSLVPGCDKIIGKTLVLDEIINYVKSLQNQVEFLVGKLSSISPLLIEHEASLDTNTLQSENLCRFAPPLPSLLEYNSSQLNFFTETSLTSSFPLQHDKFPDLVSQNDGMTLWNMNDPYGFSNIYSL